ncbi:Nitrate transporter [Pleurostoma richardsiae]|uniref:Nitrate/nitrite transporter n=1 Tax=Pleurostoma richardsiae TaxID=41990 RepID=A0AA38SF86_9PEZI|nr:Nitrate transporter [Pleurostoma richardsiae]
MGFNFKISDLWKVPDVNPVNRKARSVPVLNPINMYGRVFFFSWFGFMVAFWAWYTFPPLLTHTIKADLKLTPAQVANSNIVSICATLLVRVVAGPLCDRFGPRLVFGGLLLVGSIPLGLAPLVQNASGLYASRFFIGILGGSFVPCLVWSTGFFDKNIVGTANAIAGGWGNAGGGITYFIMPAVYDSFVRRGYGPGPAWRLTFIVPLIVVIVTAICMIVLCPDTPVGKWSERKEHVQENLRAHGINANVGVVDVPGHIDEKPPSLAEAPLDQSEKNTVFGDHEAPIPKEEMLQVAQGEVVVKPTRKEAMMVAVSPQTWVMILTYFCSFGAELSINAVLANFYLKNFKYLGQTGAANWAAMFGFLNVVTRPLGGVIADLVYKYSGHNLWLKKSWIHVCGILTGVFLIIIGKVDPRDQSTFSGLVALMAIFLEAGNGANFALVPHVHPFANGIVSGLTGAGGNLGGVIFAIIFRFVGSGSDYATAFWIIGCIHVGINVLLTWVPPIPKGQIGGR